MITDSRMDELSRTALAAEDAYQTAVSAARRNQGFRRQDSTNETPALRALRVAKDVALARHGEARSIYLRQ
jgi:hypothetical protein